MQKKEINNITVIVEPLQPGESFRSKDYPNPKSLHETTEYLRLIQELKAQTKTTVTLIEDTIQAAPKSGFVLLYPRSFGFFFEKIVDTCGPDLWTILAPRLILLNVQGIASDEIMGAYNVAAVVREFDYMYWWHIAGWPDHACQQKMHGHLAPVKALGLDYDCGYEPGQYCEIKGEKRERLPVLLLRYLQAYAETALEL